MKSIQTAALQVIFYHIKPHVFFVSVRCVTTGLAVSKAAVYSDVYLPGRSSLVPQMVDSFFGFSLYIDSSDKRVIFAAKYAYHIAETDFFLFCQAVSL